MQLELELEPMWGASTTGSGFTVLASFHRSCLILFSVLFSVELLLCYHFTLLGLVAYSIIAVHFHPQHSAVQCDLR